MPKPTTPENNTFNLSREEYLADLLNHIEFEYTALATKYNGLHSQDPNKIDHLDEVFAYVLGAKYAQAENLDLDKVLAKQAQAQAAILNFANLRPVLSACLQTYLYKLSAEDILPTSHGVVQGILEATKPYIPQIINLTYVECKDYAEALYNKILEYTHGFATALPLPNISPLTDNALTTAPKVEYIPTGVILPFDLTTHLSRVINDLQADVITANTDVLSEAPDISTLTPVNNSTLKEVACLLIGRASTPYLLDGELVIHDETVNKYYRVVPKIGSDNYVSYGFRVCNYWDLYRRIYRQQELLKTSVKYKEYYADVDPNSFDCSSNSELDPFSTDTPKDQKADIDELLGHLKFEPLPQGDPKRRKEIIEKLAEWDKVLTDRINDIFDDPHYNKTHAKAQAEYRKNIKPIQYFYPTIVFISAHKLAAYTYYPQEYSDLIIRTPIDPETGKPVKYHVHHVGGKGSENDNRRENLRIITKQLNDELRHTSRPVIYRDTRYNTLKSYCEATKAGSLPALSQATANLTIGDQIIFKNRIYSIDPYTGEIIIATDDPQATRYVYNGIEYEDLKAFTDAQRLGRKSYDAIQKGIRRAKKADKTEYKHKRYKFYMDDNIITIKLV